ncbi:hypothetical protein LTR66_004544 [Elasticomyces elasticus]|nr:hypothetical protein LTR50_006467 [Elasticomyces elasticus]KAK4995703.1 hypothetical protein LTR66_004544 [Elasticomyces elasticus]
MRNLVKNAKNAALNLQIALANVPQRSSLGFRQDLIDNTNRYKQLLLGVLQELSTNDSPIKHIDLAGNYNCRPEGCSSGYDGLHPNALGEYQIAQAFSRTLHEDFKFGTGALQVPGNFPDRDVSVPSNVAAAPEDMGVRVTWNAVYGVFSYSVRYRFSDSSDWQVVQVSTNRYYHTYTVGGIQWEFQVRSEYGDTKQGGTAGLWSGSVSATAQRNTPPPPNDIRSSPTPDGLQVT